MASEWAPANTTEQALASALRDEAPAEYFRTLISATLYLPSGLDAEQRLLTCQIGDDTYLIVFTSVQAMAARLTGVPGFRTTDYAELREKWPDESWLLAVDPGLPIEAYLPIGVAAEVAAGRVELGPQEAPANDVEAALLTTMATGEPVHTLTALVSATLWLPVGDPAAGGGDLADPGFIWPIIDVDGPTIVAFTSPERMAQTAPPGAPHLEVETIDLAFAWPDQGCRLVLNPATTYELTIPGDQILGLIGHAEELMGDLADTDELARFDGFSADGFSGAGASEATPYRPPHY